ncbi:hypothetical protein ACOME3_000764 [Neoechinorhynchus agilis]
MVFLSTVKALLFLIHGFDFCYSNDVHNEWSLQYTKYDGMNIVSSTIRSSNSLSSVLNKIERNSSISRIKIKFAFFYDIVSSYDHILPNVADVSIYCRRNIDESITITKSFIHKFRHSRRLQIQNAVFGYIEDDAFEGFDNLNDLDLSINSLWRLGLNMHVDLYNLQSLQLSRNGLRNDCLKVVEKMKSLKVLDLSDNLIQRFVLTNEFNFRRLENIRIDANPLNEINLSQLAKQENLKILEFSYRADLNKLFEEEFQFENMEEFIVHGGIAHSLNSTILARMPKVKVVKILGSNLGEVPRGNNRTKTLILKRNRIGIIRSNYFDSWTNVIQLDMSSNGIVRIYKDAFFPLKKLEVLNLGQNSDLTLLPTGIFRNNELLQKLILANTNFYVFDDGVFKNVKHLRYLDVSGTPMTGIDVHRLGSKTIDYCLVKNNPFFFIIIYDNPRNRTETYFALRGLARYIPEPIQIAAGVDDVITVYNHTENFTSLAGKNLTRIQDVRLFIRGNAFSVDLSNNEISAINYDDFEDLKTLEFLCLQFNRIEKIAPRAFRNTPLLRMLDLANNQLKDIDVFHLFYGLDRLIYLRMANNGFSLFPSHHLSDLRSLKILNISSNPIRQFHNKPFKDHQSLQTIKMYNTSIELIYDL